MAVFIDENVTEGCCIIVLLLLQLEKIVALGGLPVTTWHQWQRLQFYWFTIVFHEAVS